ncbi:hypothetical protein [Thalassotalea sp. PS06]|uniref:hypothetical protein n=1 Tax=Thalassotalea sp. PS06 TaxID=2594005 RepID=UPI0011653BDB|nr:hypothetical protein [Thalassotalea sp. PS06]QDP01622.1 hypothetical protein FNC98_09910 [Thalassotalea sp. PS06]
MTCGNCGSPLKKKKRKVKSGLFGFASMLELIAVLCAGYAMVYQPAMPIQFLLITSGIVLAFVGQLMMFRKIHLWHCKNCKSEQEISRT